MAGRDYKGANESDALDAEVLVSEGICQLCRNTTLFGLLS
jgi:hypothetical protein